MIGPPSRIARRQPGRGVVEHDDRVDRRQPEGVVRRRTRRPTSCRAGRRRRPDRRRAGSAGMAWRTSRPGAGWTPILGGSSASATSAVSVRSASRSRSSSGGHRREDVRGGRGSARRRDRTSDRARSESTRRRWPTMTPCPPSTSSRASTTSSWNATRSSCTTRWRRSRRTRAAPTPSGGSPATSAATPTSGPRSCATSARTCRRPAGPRMRVRFIILAARLLGTSAVADLVKALEGDEEAAYGAQDTSPEVGRDRGRRARARGDLGAPQGRRAGRAS